MNSPVVDSFGRMACPGCGEMIPVVTHVDKPGDPATGTTVIDVDFEPMSWHIAGHGPEEVAR